MKVNGSYTFPASKEVVWPMLLDPEVLANVMPGCESLDQVADNQYEGILKIKVGPVQGNFKGKVTINDINELEGYSLVVDGKGAPGFVKGDGSLKLQADGDNTILHYEGDAQVGGRLASVGQRLLDSSAKAIIRQSLEGLEKQVEYRVNANGAAATGETTQPLPAAAPSQTEFALGVARNMIEDVLTEEDQEELIRKIVIAGGILLVLFVLLDWLAGRIASKTARHLKK